jgi:hypothetical protein
MAISGFIGVLYIMGSINYQLRPEFWKEEDRV